MKKLNLYKGYAFATLFVLTFSVITSTSFAQTTPRKPIHHIVLIHGIGGDHTTFAGMGDALKTHLSKQKPQFDWNIHTYLYKTGRKQKGSSYQFAKELTTFLDLRVKNASTGLILGDKISFVMHSQGGIVGGIWMYMSAVGRAGFSTDYLAFMDSYISIGTPFWGSRIASLGEVNEMFGGLMGVKEAYDMHPLSNKSFDSKISILNLVTQPELNAKVKHIQIINIAARAPILQIGSSYVTSDLMTSDSDMAVEIPAANMNFLYGRLGKPPGNPDGNSPWNDVVKERENTFNSFKEIKFSDLYVVPGIHMSSKPEKNTSTTMVTPKCLTNLYCGHPTLLFLTQSLMHSLRHNEISDAEKKKGRTFFLMFNVRLPLFSIYSVDDVSLSEDTQGGSQFDWNPQGSFPYRKLSRSHLRLPELYAYTGDQTGDVVINDVRILKVGRFLKRPTDTSGTNAFASFVVSAPGLAPRHIKVPLKVDHTTFVDIDLN